MARRMSLDAWLRQSMGTRLKVLDEIEEKQEQDKPSQDPGWQEFLRKEYLKRKTQLSVSGR